MPITPQHYRGLRLTVALLNTFHPRIRRWVAHVVCASLKNNDKTITTKGQLSKAPSRLDSPRKVR